MIFIWDFRDALVNRGAQILACYRKNCASPSSPGQLILPECMKLLPLYINCLLNCDALSGGPDMTVDDRTFNMYAAQTSHVGASLGYLYPRLIPLMEMGPPTSSDHILPMPIRCTYDKLRDDGAYLLDNGIHMFLWIGHKVIPEWIHGVLGNDPAAQVDLNRLQLQEFDNPYSQQVWSISFYPRLNSTNGSVSDINFIRITRFFLFVLVLIVVSIDFYFKVNKLVHLK